MVPILALHCLPEYWGPDSGDFRPSRFEQPLKHPFQYVPFSAGARSCIGQRFAQMEMVSS